MTLPAPFIWRGEHISASLPGGEVLFTTRRGGVSHGAYSSLNLGASTGDDPAAVAANRERVARLAGLPWSRVLHARQVHGAEVARPDRRAGEADGQTTALRDAAAIVFTADCLPIALCADGAVAMLHGGWRGLAAGIVGEGVRALNELGARGPVTAALGPSARGCCYEVGEEVHAAFAGIEARRGARNIALDAVAAAQLRAAGVADVLDTGLCTICSDPALFFSHRRDAGVTGRQGGVVWMR